ncbi:hypothetical protein PGT21_016328 [Puccinia graminis f. sp. tritici]|uniref:Uncharacterized protein n=1 Tax=Puccinia graminis f. sp. tritici TaxID=56615 RepID=A0A5B0LUK7_PUCGR|nr:hypothetical protein PGT21_016328 [Puccinia graminis f. sp. tritici]KAA1093497.1 hypothetical protein PGTUg99_023013 [Puccinia graminis f. sp. tritici]
MGVSLYHLSVFFSAVYFSQVVHGATFPFNLLSKSENLPHPVVGEKDGMNPVSQIFGKDYMMNSEDQQNVERHISSIPQLGNLDRTILSSTFYTGRFLEAQKELMWEEWSFLRNELKRFTGQNILAIWTAKKSDFVFHLTQLNKLHVIMGEDLEILKSSESIREQEYEDMREKIKQHVESLLQLLYQMSFHFGAISPELRFLDLQRLALVTLYYFYKHNLIGQQDLDFLFTRYQTVGDFAQYVFQSYKFGQQVNTKSLPISSKNALNYWYYFPFMDMLEGLGEEHKKKFSTEYNKFGFAYYETAPIEKQNKEMKEDLILFRVYLLDEVYYSMSQARRHHSVHIMNLVSPQIQDQSFEYLITMFTNFHTHHEHEKYYVELEHLFQLIENQKEYKPDRYARFCGNVDGFEEKFGLMSSSSQIRADVEKLQIYLKKTFKGFAWPFPLSYSQRNIEISNKNIEELRVFAKHLKMVESEYLENKQHIGPDDPLYIYSQDKLITSKINDIKENIINSSKYYENYLCKASVVSHLFPLDKIKKLFKQKVN